MKKLIRYAILLIFLFSFVIYSSGHGVPIVEEIVDRTATEPIEESIIPQAKPVTNVDVTLIDKINNSQIQLKNCVLVLAGELKICEDSFSYNNTFVDGNLYKITVVVELKGE